MEEEFNRSEDSSSDPSDDALDRAIAQAKAAAEQEIQRNAGQNSEDEEDDSDDDTTANDDAPGDDDEEDDADVVAANTPTDDDEDVEVTPQESRKKTATDKEQGSDDEDDTKTLSRKQRGKIIEEYRQELLASEAKRRQLEEQVKAQEQEDESLNREVSRALGTDAEYEKAVEDGLAGDDDAATKARLWKANRAFYRKLVTSAGKTYQNEFAQQYWETVKELPGVDMDVIAKKDLTTIIKHVHESGAAAAEQKYKDQIEKLQKDVQTWRGRAKSAGPQQAGSTRRSPITGGGEPVSNKAFNWRAHYLDSQGLPTDEFDNLVRQHGFEAVTSGKFFKRGK